MTDPLAQLRRAIAEAAAVRDAALAQYDALAEPGERLLTAIAEHRSKAAELASATDDELYAERLAEQAALEREIAELRSTVDVSQFHDARRTLAEAGRCLGELQQRYEHECWASLPAASAHLFQAAEGSRREYERQLARLDSVAMVAHETAHRQINGVDPRLTPAWRAYLKLSEMAAILTGNLGLGAVRDFRTGPQLVDSIHAGQAIFGDVSRWQPPSRAPVDGSIHINREAPLTQAPHTSETPDPSSSTPEADSHAHAAADAPQHAVSPSWLDASPFRPKPPG
jgi:hypothetical protein